MSYLYRIRPKTPEDILCRLVNFKGDVQGSHVDYELVGGVVTSYTICTPEPVSDEMLSKYHFESEYLGPCKMTNKIPSV